MLFVMMLMGVLSFNLIFWLKVADQSYFLVSPYALGVSGPVRDYSCKLISKRFPAHAIVKCLLILLLLSGAIALFADPVNFGLVNRHSIRNKGPFIGDIVLSNNLDVRPLQKLTFIILILTAY